MLELIYIAISFIVLSLAILLVWKNFIDANTTFMIFRKNSLDDHNKLRTEIVSLKLKAEMGKKDFENWDLNQREMKKQIQDISNRIRKVEALFSMIYQKEANKLNAQ